VTALHRIDWRHRHGWIEISLGERSMWGKGYATETLRLCTAYAFEELGFEKVLASQYGLLRRNVFFGGEWHDEWLGEILREN
jgi:RimJ/RimL family protein N-acetyltransferase